MLCICFVIITRILTCELCVRLIHWSYITQCDDDFSFIPTQTKIKMLKISPWDLKEQLNHLQISDKVHIIIRKHKTKLFTSIYRPAFSAASLFRCLQMRALRKQKHNLARKGVSGPTLIRLCYIQRIVFYDNMEEFFHVLSDAMFIILKFDWLKLYSALLTRQ